jgi:hypothetical protein
MRNATYYAFSAAGMMVKERNGEAVIDRQPMRGENVRNRFQIITLDSEQKLLGLFRSKKLAVRKLVNGY